MLHRTRTRWSLLLLLSLLLAPISGLTHPGEAAAAMAVPAGFVNERVLTGLTEPTAVVWDKTGRMFVAQKRGPVRVVENGVLLPTPFIDLTGEVNPANDRGLLGIALHPNFPDTPYIYLLYVYDPPGLAATNAFDSLDGNGSRVGRLVRLEADAAQDYNRAKAGSRTIILGGNSTLANIGDADKDIGNSANVGAKTSCTDGSDQPIENCLPEDIISHSVGTLMFGTDGSLFVSNGDASSYNYQDVRSLRSQDLNSLAGKVLRINPDTGEGYADNPFVGTTVPLRDRASNTIGTQPCSSLAQNCARVWSYGLRNPFRMTLNQATNQPFIGDVGWSSWEEINTGRGRNFGWPCYEGDNNGSRKAGGNYPNYQGCKDLYGQGLSAVTAPVHSWNHSAGGASANAGTFYTATKYPAQYQNALFFTDYNQKWIRYLTFDPLGNATVNNFASEAAADDGAAQVTTGPDGNLYYVRLGRGGTGSGEIRRIRYAGGSNIAPTARITADVTSGKAPLPVDFSASAATDPDQPVDTPLLYTWDFGDGSAPAVGLTTSHTYIDPGSHTATLTVTDEHGTSDTDTVTITIGNTAPTATITSPALGTTFNGGATLNFTGSATDPQDALKGEPTALEWSFVLHHNSHVHPDFAPDQHGSTGSITLPNDHGNNFWVEICLTATDSDGLTSQQVCHEYLSNTVVDTFRTEPSGLEVSAGEGVPQVTPFQATVVVNGLQQLVAPPVQQHMSFSKWEDGSTTSSRFVTSGAAATTYTATYRNKPPVAMLAATPSGLRAPIMVSFNAGVSFDPEDRSDELGYTWDFGDGTTGTGATPQHIYNGVGVYTATLTVRDFLGATSTDQVLVNVPNTPPTARIEAAVTGEAPGIMPTTYRVGTTIAVRSGATDNEDGALMGNDLKWEVIRYVGALSETLQTSSGVDATFTVPERKQTSAAHPLLRAAAASTEERIEVRLTALDHNGGSATTSAWLTPQLATLTLATTPAGLPLIVNGTQQIAGQQTLVAGSATSVSAPETASVNGQSYALTGWSDGGAREHRVVVNEDMTLTASYTLVPATPTTPTAPTTPTVPTVPTTPTNTNKLWLPLMGRSG